MPIWQTEHKCGNYPWNPARVRRDDGAERPGLRRRDLGLIRDWIKAGVTAYSAWNMVLDTVGKGIDTTRDWPQNALLTVDTASKTLTLTPAYYVFRHFSQFVDPGAKVRRDHAAATRSRSRTRTAASSRSCTTAARAKTTTSSRSAARSCSSRCPAAAGRPSFRNDDRQ